MDLKQRVWETADKLAHVKIGAQELHAWFPRNDLSEHFQEIIAAAMREYAEDAGVAWENESALQRQMIDELRAELAAVREERDSETSKLKELTDRIQIEGRAAR